MIIMRALGRFALICLGGSLAVGGLGLTMTGIGAIFGIPMIAIGVALIDRDS